MGQKIPFPLLHILYNPKESVRSVALLEPNSNAMRSTRPLPKCRLFYGAGVLPIARLSRGLPKMARPSEIVSQYNNNLCQCTMNASNDDGLVCFFFSSVVVIVVVVVVAFGIW